ncbi:hypothetical protein BLA60_12380 [Actinophytocola xinjiangensis]|uniref:Carrier domain-containing protein n=1 Tax=Actinophytocola xinjiangensis TaxID=485602 RepID=A0A7Z0WNP5_9PSEU|nr:non-ribosomal peptide synthetase [Actinophytocola xinjiangensis]OLF11712.1 hypothetical protein BLA60_12380 [Actinophytocola xinjiangensis]
MTLLDILRRRSAEQPDRVGFTYLDDDASLDYRGLADRATAIGDDLRGRCAPGDRVLLLHPPGLDYLAALFGCWDAGMIAVPAYPPRANKSAVRLAGIIADACPALALTVASAVPGVADALADLPIRVVASDALTPSGREVERAASSDTVALLQYTSGSTAAPKGVVITHGNLTHNLGHIARSFRQDADSRAVLWLPPYHDMGLVGGLLQPLYGGFPVTLMSPMSLARSPMTWLRAVSDLGATSSGGPNFGYELAVRRISPEQRAELDLSRWRLAFTGAEPVDPDTLRRFAEHFAPCGFRRDAFYPCYGLAEATLLVSGGAAGAPAVTRRFDRAALGGGHAVPSATGQTLVSCGTAMPDQDIHIVDPDRRVGVPDGAVGEIWLRGASVGAGYWNQPEETAAVFGAHRADTGAGPYLRTGDLGFLDGGELFVTGRRKDLIILNGRNHYPRDIEGAAQSADPALRPDAGAAFSVPVDGVERLVVVNEVGRTDRDLAEIVAAVRTEIAARHEIRAHAVVLVRPASVPRTTSGKVQRHRCRADYLAGNLKVVTADVDAAPSPGLARDDLLAAEDRAGLIEAYLRDRAAAGLDSLAAVQLGHEIEAATGVPLPLERLIGGLDPAALAREIADGVAETTPRAASGTTDLSPGEHALWIQHRLAPDSPVHHLAAAVRLTANVAAAHGFLAALVDRHEALRTRFPAVDGRPTRVVDAEPGAWFHREDGTDIASAVRRPFDLERGPLLRAHLFTLGPDDHVLVIVLHHIIADFWSAAVLVSPAEVVGRYPDFVDWQARLLAGPDGARSKKYWADRLSGPLPVLRLPADRPRPAARRFAGASTRLELDGELAAGLRRLAQRERTTVFTVLLAAYRALLFRHTGDEDVIVGAPVAARGPVSLADVVGNVSTMVPLRTLCAADLAFTALLARDRETVHGALAHQHFPFPLMLDGVGRDTAVPPVFQTTITLHPAGLDPAGLLPALALGLPGARGRLGGVEVESVALDRLAAQFDLALEAAETAGGIATVWTYNTDLFDAATIERFGVHFRSLLRAVVADPSVPLGRIPLADARPGPRGAMTAPEQRSLSALFEEQAALTPAVTALVCGRDRLDYAEVNARANRLARALRGRGVRRGDVVGVRLPHGVDLPVAVLAVLKLGAVCLPIDPALPDGRIAAMLRIAGAETVVTPETLGANEDSANLGLVMLPDEQAWLVFTSGSTGEPKAVALEHRQILHRLGWMWREHPFGPDDVACLKSSVAFVDSIWELLGSVLCGVPTVVVPETRDVGALVAALAEHRVTRLLLVPTLLRAILREPGDLPALGLWLSSGEPLDADLLGRFRTRFPHARIINVYGMSEAWDVTSFEPDATPPATVPIGLPLPDTAVHVLDTAVRPVPQGVPGELYVGGRAVARGYVGDPAMTSVRFVPDPFAAEPGGRLYRTGDLVRQGADGVLEHLGRVDRQVKVGGVRVETAEVEAALAGHEGVVECAVVVRPDARGTERLVAYLVLEVDATASDVRGHARRTLPGAMTPAEFVTLPGLPRTTGGKLDRAALPEPPADRGTPDAEFVAPASGLERRLAALWADVLGVERVGVHDNFFDLGGTSATLIEVHQRIGAEVGVELPVVTLFQAPTVGSVAAHVDGRAGPSDHLRRASLAARRRRDAVAGRVKRSGGKQ